MQKDKKYGLKRKGGGTNRAREGGAAMGLRAGILLCLMIASKETAGVGIVENRLLNQDGIVLQKLDKAHQLTGLYTIFVVCRPPKIAPELDDVIVAVNRSIQAMKGDLTSYDDFELRIDEIADRVKAARSLIDFTWETYDDNSGRFGRQRRGLIDGIGYVISQITGLATSRAMSEVERDLEEMRSNQEEEKHVVGKLVTYVDKSIAFGVENRANIEVLKNGLQNVSEAMEQLQEAYESTKESWFRRKEATLYLDRLRIAVDRYYRQAEEYYRQRRVLETGRVPSSLTSEDGYQIIMTRAGAAGGRVPTRVWNKRFLSVIHFDANAERMIYQVEMPLYSEEEYTITRFWTVPVTEPNGNLSRTFELPEEVAMDRVSSKYFKIERNTRCLGTSPTVCLPDSEEIGPSCVRELIARTNASLASCTVVWRPVLGGIVIKRIAVNTVIIAPSKPIVIYRKCKNEEVAVREIITKPEQYELGQSCYLRINGTLTVSSIRLTRHNMTQTRQYVNTGIPLPIRYETPVARERVHKKIALSEQAVMRVGDFMKEMTEARRIANEKKNTRSQARTGVVNWVLGGILIVVVILIILYFGFKKEMRVCGWIEVGKGLTGMTTWKPKREDLDEGTHRRMHVVDGPGHRPVSECEIGSEELRQGIEATEEELEQVLRPLRRVENVGETVSVKGSDFVPLTQGNYRVIVPKLVAYDPAELGEKKKISSEGEYVPM